MVCGDVNFTSILHHLLEMLLESHLRLMMSVLCCFSLDVLRLTRAAPRTERSITTEQCPGRRLQIPQIFLHTPTTTSASTSSATNPMMLRSTRLWQRGCTLVASLITLHSCRSIRAIVVQRKNIAIGNFPMALYYSIIHAFFWKEWSKTSTWTYFSKYYANKTKCISARITF